MNKPKNLTTKEVAAILNCSESLVRRKDMKNKLGAFYIGVDGLRYPEDKVDQYVNNQKERASQQFAEDKAEVKKTHRRKKLHSNFDLF
ncbi:MAG: helix-turn-helix domain-containing protein [Halodesulfovibrio sp.]|uniref:helix-turn-helix domain-containing protein n=1 Tax=Halodesulfovibrio sp. TaxID=1912772 RepID=UPI00359CFFAA